MNDVEKLQVPQISQATLYANLVQVLEDLASLYGNLLEILRGEKACLIFAEIEKLKENTRTKEALLYKIRTTDRQRQQRASLLGKTLGLPPEELRLLEIAKKMKDPEAEQLRAIHQTLSLQIERAVDFNRENEQYASSALKTLNGAIKNIQQIVSVKPTYGKQGQMAGSQEANAGSFVSKEA